MHGIEISVLRFVPFAIIIMLILLFLSVVANFGMSVVGICVIVSGILLATTVDGILIGILFLLAGSIVTFVCSCL